mmetsp:Transcript_9333/g.23230  ORF Transcript_9333/g.23230 Transcript_9333/m.23230 type:complete len:295 (+) Transcript_9333:844-1728(+)
MRRPAPTCEPSRHVEVQARRLLLRATADASRAHRGTICGARPRRALGAGPRRGCLQAGGGAQVGLLIQRRALELSNAHSEGEHLREDHGQAPLLGQLEHLRPLLLELPSVVLQQIGGDVRLPDAHRHVQRAVSLVVLLRGRRATLDEHLEQAKVAVLGGLVHGDLRGGGQPDLRQVLGPRPHFAAAPHATAQLQQLHRRPRPVRQCGPVHGVDHGGVPHMRLQIGVCEVRVVVVRIQGCTSLHEGIDAISIVPEDGLHELALQAVLVPQGGDRYARHDPGELTPSTRGQALYTK